MPEKTKSGGFAFRMEQRAMFTQSVGRPVHDPGPLVLLPHAQRTVHRERVRRRALLAVGGHDVRLEPGGPRGALEHREAVTVDAVVVRDEGPHAPGPS